jgi:integrase
VDIISNLAAAEKRRMLDSTYGLDRIMLLLIFETGLEVEDLIKLRVSDVDIEVGSILIPKVGRQKISSLTLDELKSYLNSRPNQSFIFEGRCGKPITVKWKRCVLEKLLQRSKFEDQG